MDVIRFYKTTDAFGCFSNFSAHPLFDDWKAWPTSEHYFQAQKFLAPEVRRQIRLAETPRRAAHLGRSRDRSLRDDWEVVKDDVMRFAVRLKVSQHADVRETLRATNNAMLVEHTKNDSYWGDGGDGTGKNMLGRILMEVRGELADLPSRAPAPPWVEFPEYGDASDLGWRMGPGETYLDEWVRWYHGMHETNRQRYLAMFRTPSYWTDWLFELRNVDG